MAVCLVAGFVARVRRGRSFAEHRLNAARHAAAQALVLCKPLGRANRGLTREARVCGVQTVIVGDILCGAAFARGPALEWRKANARAELIDARHAVFDGISARRGCSGATCVVRRTTRRAGTASRSSSARSSGAAGARAAPATGTRIASTAFTAASRGSTRARSCTAAPACARAHPSALAAGATARVARAPVAGNAASALNGTEREQTQGGPRDASRHRLRLPRPTDLRKSCVSSKPRGMHRPSHPARPVHVSLLLTWTYSVSARTCRSDDLQVGMNERRKGGLDRRLSRASYRGAPFKTRARAAEETTPRLLGWQPSSSPLCNKLLDPTIRNWARKRTSPYRK